MGVLHKFSSLLFSSCSCMNDNHTMYKGGCLYSIFPLEIWSYQFYNKFLSNSIKTNKCLPIYISIQVRFISLLINAWRNKYQGEIQKEVCWLVQLSFLCFMRWLAWWVSDAPASLCLKCLGNLHSSGRNFHWNYA